MSIEPRPSRKIPQLNQKAIEIRRAISACAVAASSAIAAMMRFSAVRSSGRLSGVIGTPAVDQIHSGIGPQTNS